MHNDMINRLEYRVGYRLVLVAVSAQTLRRARLANGTQLYLRMGRRTGVNAIGVLVRQQTEDIWRNAESIRTGR